MQTKFGKTYRVDLFAVICAKIGGSGKKQNLIHIEQMLFSVKAN